MASSGTWGLYSAPFSAFPHTRPLMRRWRALASKSPPGGTLSRLEFNLHNLWFTHWCYFSQDTHVPSCRVAAAPVTICGLECLGTATVRFVSAARPRLRLFCAHFLFIVTGDGGNWSASAKNFGFWVPRPIRMSRNLNVKFLEINRKIVLGKI